MGATTTKHRHASADEVAAVGADLSEETRTFYVESLNRLTESGIPFLLGGAYAMPEYAGVVRHTKDLDVFCKAGDCPRILALFVEAGYTSEVINATWLAKVFNGDDFLDVIFDSSNALTPVDDTWFEHAREAEVFECRVKLVPPEEIIWSKSFVQSRDRFDGPDVVHIMRKLGHDLDWKRLLRRMETSWEILLQQIMLFRFVYPAERDAVPTWVMKDLLERVQAQLAIPAPVEQISRGVLLSRRDYKIDVDEWGYGQP